MSAWGGPRAVRAARRLAGPAGFLALAVVCSHPLSTRPTRVLPDNADGIVFAWAVAWVCHQLGTDPLHLFRANVFHPDPAALAYGEPMIGQALVAWPVWAASGNDVLTFNVLLVLTLALCGWTMFLLAREVTGDASAAVLAGLIFAFTTANYDSAARIQIVSSQWTPLALFFLVRLVRRGRLGDGIGFGLAFALQGLSCKYYQLFFATLLAVSLPFFLVAAARLGRIPWRPLLAGGALAAAIVLPFDMAQQRHLARIQTFRGVSQPATLDSYGQALASNLLYGPRFGLGATRYDDRYFPGLLPVPLAAIGILLSAPQFRRRLRMQGPASYQGLTLPFLVFGGAAFLLAFGDTLPGGLPGPFRVLNHYVPGYAQTRVPARFIMFVRLAAALFAAVGLAALLHGRSRRLRLAVMAPLALILPLEHFSAPLPAWPISSGDRVPEVYRWLKDQHPGPVLEFPPHPPRLRRWESFWQHFSTTHWLPLVNGFASYYPVHYDFVYNELLELPSERSLAVLQALGVRYVIVHPKPTDHPERDRALRRFERRVPEFADRLVLVKAFGDEGVAYPDPVRALGGERVYLARESGGPVGSEACAERDRPWPRQGWRCESEPAGCERALDGSADTVFNAPQEHGRFLRVLFPRPLEASRLALRSGPYSQSYPQAPEVNALVGGQWRRLPHRFHAVEFLARMLHCPRQAAQDLLLDPVTVEGLEVRLGAQPNRFRPWLVPEVEVYP